MDDAQQHTEVQLVTDDLQDMGLIHCLSSATPSVPGNRLWMLMTYRAGLGSESSAAVGRTPSPQLYLIMTVSILMSMTNTKTSGAHACSPQTAPKCSGAEDEWGSRGC